VTAEARLALAFMHAHASRAAMIVERMPRHRASSVLRAVPARTAAGVLGALTPPFAAAVLAQLGDEHVPPIVAAMPMDDAVTVFRALPPAQREPLLALLGEDARESLSRALPYPDGTAGAIMDPSVMRLPEEILVAEAYARLRGSARGLLYYLYVIDGEQRLVGVLDIPELMLARPRDPISAVMHRTVDRLSAWTPVSLVRDHPGWREYHAMPVVDEQDRLVGGIRYQTLRRLEREASGVDTDPSALTMHALGELFRLGTTGLVAGVAAAGTAEAGPPSLGDTPPTTREGADA
jgi:magnesium transporter